MRSIIFIVCILLSHERRGSWAIRLEKKPKSFQRGAAGGSRRTRRRPAMGDPSCDGRTTTTTTKTNPTGTTSTRSAGKFHFHFNSLTRPYCTTPHRNETLALARKWHCTLVAFVKQRDEHCLNPLLPVNVDFGPTIPCLCLLLRLLLPLLLRGGVVNPSRPRPPRVVAILVVLKKCTISTWNILTVSTRPGNYILRIWKRGFPSRPMITIGHRRFQVENKLLWYVPNRGDDPCNVYHSLTCSYHPTMHFICWSG